MNYVTYYNEIRHGYEVAKSKNKEAYVLAADGSWDVSMRGTAYESSYALTREGKKNQNDRHFFSPPTYPPIDSDLNSVSDIRKMLSEMDLKNGQSVILYINGHGSSSGEGASPGDQYIDVWGKRIKWKDLSPLLAQYPNTKFKIKTNICFGGGVHDISLLNDNVCSASSVPHFQLSSSGVTQESLSSETFFNHIKENSNTSLADASIASFREDYANLGLGTLSSFNYVDKVLGKGQFGSNQIEMDRALPRVDTNLEEVYHQFFERDKKYDSILDISPRDNVGILTCKKDKFDSIYESQIDQTQNILQNLKKSIYPGFYKLVKEAKNNLKTNKENYKSRYLAFKRSFDEKLQKIGELQTKQANLGLLSYIYNYNDEINELSRELKELKQKFEFEMKDMLHALQISQLSKKLNVFFSKANKEELEKFNQLMECEWSNL